MPCMLASRGSLQGESNQCQSSNACACAPRCGCVFYSQGLRFHCSWVTGSYTLQALPKKSRGTPQCDTTSPFRGSEFPLRTQCIHLHSQPFPQHSAPQSDPQGPADSPYFCSLSAPGILEGAKTWTMCGAPWAGLGSTALGGALTLNTR